MLNLRTPSVASNNEFVICFSESEAQLSLIPIQESVDFSFIFVHKSIFFKTIKDLEKVPIINPRSSSSSRTTT